MSQGIKAGDPAPDFSAATDGNGTLSLSDLRGRKVVLYFYPKDSTPGCTKESCDFAEAEPDFSRVGAEIVGVSRDSVASHDKFKAKYKLPFRLVSDQGGKICEAYGAWGKKKLYGRVFMGLTRATFLIDETGVVSRVWPKVKVKGHVEEVLAAIAED